MKKSLLLVCLVLFSTLGVLAASAPTLLLLTTNSGEIQIPIASIKKITYDEDGTTMQVLTTAGTQSYAVTTVSQMTLINVPNPTDLQKVQNAACKMQNATKILKDGVVYVIKDGQLYSVKGEQVQ